MMKKLLAFLLIFTSLFFCMQADAQNVVPSYSNSVLTFGDYSNARPMPTSGTLTGVYRQSGSWTQTGPITCNAVRFYCGGTVTLNNTVTGVAGIEGNNHVNAQGPLGLAAVNGGSGGSHGGAGGSGSVGTYSPVYPYQFMPLAGAAGAVSGAGGAPGDGGAGLYIEANGPIVLTSTAAVHCDAGTTGGGGGGAGGGVDFRTLSTMTLASGAVISANGSAGGTGANGGAGGGGGVVNLEAKGGLTNNATITVSAGGAGTYPAGSAGVIFANPYFEGQRLGF